MDNKKTLTDRIYSLLQGDLLGTINNPRVLKWGLLLIALALVSIFNTYIADHKEMAIDRINAQLRDLREEHTSISSQLMGETRITAIEERVVQEGLSISIPKTPPIVIYP